MRFCGIWCLHKSALVPGLTEHSWWSFVSKCYAYPWHTLEYHRIWFESERERAHTSTQHKNNIPRKFFTISPGHQFLSALFLVGKDEDKSCHHNLHPTTLWADYIPDLMELRTVKILEEIFHRCNKTLGIKVISWTHRNFATHLVPIWSCLGAYTHCWRNCHGKELKRWHAKSYVEQQGCRRIVEVRID